jgi:tRNA(His) guanylyltransferase
MTDKLGDRMKDQYEDRTRYFLPRRTFTIIRLDGKAFHSFTRGFERPYDRTLMAWMDYTAQVLCEEIQGVKMAYVQSDEISLLLTDFDKITTSAWFDGNIQKIVSVSASIATTAFAEKNLGDRKANFDSRVFTIPDRTEVENYFVWRQQDAVRNSISMTAQSLYSHKQLEGKNITEQQEMCFQKGVNWNDMPDGFKRGRMVVPKWEVIDAIWITKEREKFTQLIPKYEV